jgi:UDP-N-acetylglucosamine 2-epimerase
VIADLHFAPTAQARENLLRESIPAENILVTGNTIIDTLQLIARKPYDLHNSVLRGIPFDRRLVLVTAHRRENFGRPLVEICSAIKELIRIYGDAIHFVYPIHPNPQVHDVVHRELGNHPEITLLPPIDYESLVFLLKHVELVLTDSGGIQEEAPTFGLKVLILREKTERPEGVQAGIARLVGTNPERIITEVQESLREREQGQQLLVGNPYGDGKASHRILEALKERASSTPIDDLLNTIPERTNKSVAPLGHRSFVHS